MGSGDLVRLRITMRLRWGMEVEGGRRLKVDLLVLDCRDCSSEVH